jgi:hypothetical protein
MTPTIEEDRDRVFSASYTSLIIQERYRVYLHERNQRDLVKFTQFYWESVKGYGRYLKDVDFYDLTPDEREELTCKAFLMWRNYRVETGKLV